MNSSKIPGAFELLFISFEAYFKKYLRPILIVSTIELALLIVGIFAISVGIKIMHATSLAAILGIMFLIFVAAVIIAWCQIVLYGIFLGKYENNISRRLFGNASSKIFPLIWTRAFESLFTFCASIFLVIPGVICLIFFAFSDQVVIAENKSGLEALGGSFKYCREKFLRIFNYYILLILIVVIYFIIIYYFPVIAKQELLFGIIGVYLVNPIIMLYFTEAYKRISGRSGLQETSGSEILPAGAENIPGPDTQAAGQSAVAAATAETFEQKPKSSKPFNYLLLIIPLIVILLALLFVPMFNVQTTQNRTDYGDSGNATVTGKVYGFGNANGAMDDSSIFPLPGVEVFIGKKKSKTDANGAFEIAGVSNEEKIITAVATSESAFVESGKIVMKKLPHYAVLKTMKNKVNLLIRGPLGKIEKVKTDLSATIHIKFQGIDFNPKSMSVIILRNISTPDVEYNETYSEYNSQIEALEGPSGLYKNYFKYDQSKKVCTVFNAPSNEELYIFIQDNENRRIIAYERAKTVERTSNIIIKKETGNNFSGVLTSRSDRYDSSDISLSIVNKSNINLDERIGGGVYGILPDQEGGVKFAFDSVPKLKDGDFYRIEANAFSRTKDSDGDVLKMLWDADPGKEIAINLNEFPQFKFIPPTPGENSTVEAVSGFAWEPLNGQNQGYFLTLFKKGENSCSIDYYTNDSKVILPDFLKLSEGDYQWTVRALSGSNLDIADMKDLLTNGKEEYLVNSANRSFTIKSKSSKKPELQPVSSALPTVTDPSPVTNQPPPIVTQPPPAAVAPIDENVRPDIHGVVYNDETPLKGVRVFLAQKSGSPIDQYLLGKEYDVITDSNGYYQILTDKLSSGDYYLYFTTKDPNLWGMFGTPVKIDINTSTVKNGYLSKKLKLISPVNHDKNVTLKPTFDWEDYPNAVIYDCYLHNNQTRENIFYKKHIKESQMVSPVVLEKNTEYQWSVDAYNMKGRRIAYYSCWLFTTRKTDEPESLENSYEEDELKEDCKIYIDILMPEVIGTWDGEKIKKELTYQNNTAPTVKIFETSLNEYGEMVDYKIMSLIIDQKNGKTTGSAQIFDEGEKNNCMITLTLLRTGDTWKISGFSLLKLN